MLANYLSHFSCVHILHFVNAHIHKNRTILRQEGSSYVSKLRNLNLVSIVSKTTDNATKIHLSVCCFLCVKLTYTDISFTKEVSMKKISDVDDVAILYDKLFYSSEHLGKILI